MFCREMTATTYSKDDMLLGSPKDEDVEKSPGGLSWFNLRLRVGKCGKLKLNLDGTDVECAASSDAETEGESHSNSEQYYSSLNSPQDTDVPANNGAFESPQRNILGFIWSEVMSRAYDLENDEARYSEKRKKVYAFVKIPRELEKFLAYGFLQCLDAFLYFFTFLPLRFVIAVAQLIFYPICGFKLRSPFICDILKVIIVLIASVIMMKVDTSVVYHVIRGQAVIKLYIFFNMLEIADKLFSSFGQDILDSLFWTATEKSKKETKYFGFIPHLIMAIVYVSLHTLLVLFQATTLNVAFNSQNKALLTIMLSNNFVELKGSVFKKFAKNNLFQMACSDVRERFHYLILLSIVIVRNMTAVNWQIDHFWEMLPDLVLVLLGEVLVDWLKHAFITKFNEIPYEVYKDFTITIAYDAVKSRQNDAFSHHSDQVSRRMGFIPLPLTVLVVRIMSQSVHWFTPSGMLILLMIYLTLVTLKILNSLLLLGRACVMVEKYEKAQEHLKLLERMQTKRAKSAPTSPRLSLIEFSDVMQQNHNQPKGFTFSDILQRAAEIAIAEKELELNERTALSRSQSVTNIDKKKITQTPIKVQQTINEGETISPVTELSEVEAVEISDNSSPRKRAKHTSECISLQDVNRYTLINDDRIES